MRAQPMGDEALLVDLDDGPGTSPAAFAQVVLAAGLPDVVEVVPAAVTVLLRTRPGTDLSALARTVLGLAGTSSPGTPARVEADVLEVPVTYDGSDLADVAEHTGLAVEDVVAVHTGQVWTVAFCGFAPGFGYLLGDDRLDVPRRSTPRTAVPPGSIALAGRYCGVYPRPSPGGWQLIGRTDLEVWDLDRDPPALLRPGVRVRFVDLGGAGGGGG